MRNSPGGWGSIASSRPTYCGIVAALLHLALKARNCKKRRVCVFFLWMAMLRLIAGTFTNSDDPDLVAFQQGLYRLFKPRSHCADVDTVHPDA